MSERRATRKKKETERERAGREEDRERSSLQPLLFSHNLEGRGVDVCAGGEGA